MQDIDYFHGIVSRSQKEVVSDFESHISLGEYGFSTDHKTTHRHVWSFRLKNYGNAISRLTAASKDVLIAEGDDIAGLYTVKGGYNDAHIIVNKTRDFEYLGDFSIAYKDNNYIRDLIGTFFWIAVLAVIFGFFVLRGLVSSNFHLLPEWLGRLISFIIFWLLLSIGEFRKIKQKADNKAFLSNIVEEYRDRYENEDKDENTGLNIR